MEYACIKKYFTLLFANKRVPSLVGKFLNAVDMSPKIHPNISFFYYQTLIASMFLKYKKKNCY